MSLTEIEQRIIRRVVDAYFRSEPPLKRKTLALEFSGDYDAIDRLIQQDVLESVGGGDAYQPRAMAFHFYGDPGIEQRARHSIETLVRVIDKLYRESDEPNLSRSSLLERARQFDRNADADVIRLGLLLSNHFGLFTGWTGGGPNSPMTPLGIQERVLKMNYPETLWDEFVKKQLLRWEASTNPTPTRTSLPHPDVMLRYNAGLLTASSNVEASNRVFIVHGRDNKTKNRVFNFVCSLGLEPVILHLKPNQGRTVIEKFEAHSDVEFAVVLLTPDDIGALASKKPKLEHRARQNVILELGYFIGKLGRNRVCAIHTREIELPSDIHGVIWIPLDSAGEWQSKLRAEIVAAGLPAIPDTSRS